MKKDPTALIEQIRQGSDSAFTELCGMYKTLIENSARRYSAGVKSELGSPIDDFRQEATFALFRAANTFDLDQTAVTFGLYAKTCIRNALISLIRKANARPKVSDEAVDGESDKGETPEELAISSEVIEAISAKLTEVLTPYEKTVFLRYAAGEKPREIAKAIGKSAKSASNAIFRARAKVKPFLGNGK